METKLSLLLLAIVLVKVVSCQWVLDVQLRDYQILRHVELREVNGSITECCCDSDTCAESGQTLDTCPAECDIFFNVILSDCQEPRNCIISTMEEIVSNSASEYFYGVTVRFTSSLQTIPDNLILTVEMKDMDLSPPSQEIMDTFVTPVNLAGENDLVYTTGHEGIATLIVRYELTCTDSTCRQPVNALTSQATPSVLPSCIVGNIQPEIQTITITMYTTSTITTPSVLPSCIVGNIQPEIQTITITMCTTSTIATPSVLPSCIVGNIQPEMQTITTTMYTTSTTTLVATSITPIVTATYILFIIIGFSAIVLSIILGCLLYRKSKTVKILSANCTSGHEVQSSPVMRPHNVKEISYSDNVSYGVATSMHNQHKSADFDQDLTLSINTANGSHPSANNLILSTDNEQNLTCSTNAAYGGAHSSTDNLYDQDPTCSANTAYGAHSSTEDLHKQNLTCSTNAAYGGAHSSTDNLYDQDPTCSANTAYGAHSSIDDLYEQNHTCSTGTAYGVISSPPKQGESSDDEQEEESYTYE